MKELGKVLTIIPAKSSSKRLKGKNSLLLNNKPLIYYTIDAAKKSDVCGEIMVSTENDEIAEYAKSQGVSVPFMRPDYLAHDPYEVNDVCIHVLEEYAKTEKQFDTLIILLATSPLRSVDDIKNSIELYQENDGKFLMSVSTMDPHYYHALKFNSDGIKLSKVFPDDIFHSRSNTIPVRCNGAITIVDVKEFISIGTYYGKPLLGYKMPWYRSIDIDTEQDLLFAQILIESGNYNS